MPRSAFLGCMAIIGDGPENRVFWILEDEPRYDPIGQDVQTGRNELAQRRYSPPSTRERWLKLKWLPFDDKIAFGSGGFSLINWPLIRDIYSS